MEKSPDILQQITSEAALESTGSFSLDPHSMEAKLGQHQLPTRDHFVLKFVQSAVVAGATEIHFKTTVIGGLEVSFDSCPWFPEDLQQVNLRDTHKASPEFAHLITGLRTAVRTKAHWELISSRARLTESGLECLETATHPVPCNTIRLQWGRGLGKILRGISLQAFWRGARLLRSQARHAPIAVFLNGEGLNRHPGTFNLPLRLADWIKPMSLDADVDLHGVCYFLPNQGLGEVMGSAMTLCRDVTWLRGDLLDPDGWETLVPTTWPGAPGQRPYQQVESPPQELPGIHYGQLPALGCVAIVQRCPLSGSLGSIVQWVCDGVLLNQERPDGLPRGYKLWVSARGLNTDLSQFQILKDERYQQLLQALKVLIRAVSRKHLPQASQAS